MLFHGGGWTIASGDRGEPIGVLIGAKRETANCVVALGVGVRAGRSDGRL